MRFRASKRGNKKKGKKKINSMALLLNKFQKEFSFESKFHRYSIQLIKINLILCLKYYFYFLSFSFMIKFDDSYRKDLTIFLNYFRFLFTFFKTN